MKYGSAIIKNSFVRFLLIICVVNITLMMACGSQNSSPGVARIENGGKQITASNTSQTGLAVANSDQSLPNSFTTVENVTVLSEEEIATAFAECLRTEGINVSDPELNADGTVNMMALRQSMANDPNFNFQNAGTRETLEKCVPLLQNASFAGQPTQEDQIELQDNLLEIAQCLRDAGINAKDPDFSGGRGLAFQSMFSELNLDRDSLQEAMSECSETIFGNSTPGRGPGRPPGR